MADRAPWLPTAETDQADMTIPHGLTCSDCARCRRCTLAFGHIPQDRVCDWSPNRFRQSTNQMEAEHA